MPAHLPTSAPSPALPVLQKIWRHLIQEDFWLYPTEDDLDEDNLPPKMLILKPMVALELISDFKLGLERAFEIAKVTQAARTSGESVTQLEWNYLGKNEERGAYLEYLQRFFWTQQDNPELLSSSQYQNMVEEPWRILNHLEYLQQSPALPTDYFTEGTTKFIESLSLILKGWELNPFLLHTDSGSLQWRITISDALTLDGCIFAQDEDLWLQIEMTDLTRLN
jgi:hypothetical protein